MKKLDDYLIKYTKYKWEFLRRNKNYIVDCAKVKQDKYSEGEKHFLEKWNLSTPLIPFLSYDQYIEYFTEMRMTRKQTEKAGVSFNGFADLSDKISFTEDYILDPHTTMYFSLIPSTSKIAPVLPTDLRILQNHKKEEVLNHDLYYFGIDLRYPKNRILKEFEAHLDRMKDNYERFIKLLFFNYFCEERKIHRLPLKRNDKDEFDKLYKENLSQRKQLFTERKLHFDNFDDYLQVYDLRVEGTSWAKITAKLKLNSVQSARNYHKAACELIEKGIDLYVK